MDTEELHSLIQKLITGIDSSINKSDELAEVITTLRRGGYGVSLSLELGVIKLEPELSEQELPLLTDPKPLVDQNGIVDQKIFNPKDRKFLRILKIKPE